MTNETATMSPAELVRLYAAHGRQFARIHDRADFGESARMIREDLPRLNEIADALDALTPDVLDAVERAVSVARTKWATLEGRGWWAEAEVARLNAAESALVRLRAPTP